VAEAETGVPGLQPPHASETLQEPDVPPETEFTHPADKADEADETGKAGKADEAEGSA
jgi:hypothetical protein